MTLNNPSIGEGYAPAYQISSTPYVTSSYISLGEIQQTVFNAVTRFFIVKNVGDPASVVSVGFTRNGLDPANGNFFFLSGSESFSAELRTDRLLFSGSAGNTMYTLVAGLTSIPAYNFLKITGSNGFTGVG